MNWRWLDLRAVALAAVLAVAAALPSITTSIERRDYYFFDVTLTSTSAGSIQLFWDQGKGFSEHESSRQPIKIEPQPVVYRFMMPMGRFEALRLDPVDGAGQFTFTRAQIVDRRGRIMKVFLPQDLLPGGNILQMWLRGPTAHVSTDPASNDPIINLRLDEPLVLKGDAAIWWDLGWPVALPVLALGFVLGLPAVARRLSSWARPIGATAQLRPGTSLMLLATLVVTIQCHPVIFQGRSFASPNNGGHMLYDSLPTLPGYDDDQSTHTASSDTGALLFQHLYYPMVQRDAIRAGELPLWNRYSLSGEPLLGQGQSMFGDPLNFITIVADGAAWAWDLRFLIARWILAAALGGIVWQLTRHLGAAALTVIGGGFIGFFTYRLVHPANFSICYAPLILLAWTRLHVAGTPPQLVARLAALVGANWMTMTSGTVKEAYMLVLGLNFAGAMLLLIRPECSGRRWFLLGVSAAAGAGFVLLSAPLWASFLSAWGHSMTGYDTPQAHTLPWTQSIGFFDDIFYRQSQKDEAVVAPALNFLFFAGTLWWILQPRTWRSWHAGSGLLIAALPPFALVFGIVPPSVIVTIPFVGNIVHVGNTFSCVLLVLIAALGGVGIADAWKRLGEPAASRTILRFWAGNVALLTLYFAATTGHAKSPFFWGYAFALAVTVSALPLGVHWGNRKNASPGPLWIMLVLALPLLLWRHGQYRESFFERYVFAPGPRADLHAHSPALDLIKNDQSQPGRAVGFDSVLYASYNTVARLEGAYGVDAVRSQHYYDLAVALGHERVWNWDFPNLESTAPDLIRKYDLYNVTHWLATRRNGPREIPGVDLLGQTDLDVYRSPTAWPRAFFCDEVVGYEKPSDFARLLLGGDGRPFAARQFSDSTPSSALRDTPSSQRTVHPALIYRLEPNATTFTIDAPHAGFAVLTETYYLDDFEVTINGRRADYFRVNHAFKGVELPAAGTYEISFRYWPKHLTTALRASLVGAILLGLGAFWLWRRPFPVDARTA